MLDAVVDSVRTDGSGATAVLRATLTETAVLTDGHATLDTTDESYAMEYRLRREGQGSAQRWHIIAGRTL